MNVPLLCWYESGVAKFDLSEQLQHKIVELIFEIGDEQLASLGPLITANGLQLSTKILFSHMQTPAYKGDLALIEFTIKQSRKGIN